MAAICGAMDKKFVANCRKLGLRVKTLRHAAGVSQEELAFQAELDRTYVSQIERGVGNPSILVLHKLATALKVDLKDLFFGA